MVLERCLGGGSPQDIVVADIDGDGKHEAHCLAYNNSAYFSFEATGADTYTIGDTNYVKLASQDDWTLGMGVADVNNDGKHEIYIPSYFDKKLLLSQIVMEMHNQLTPLVITTNHF